MGFVECGTPDGGFGDKTELAVKNFQKNYGITVDGVVGSETETAINFCIDKINEGVFGVDVSTYQKTMKFENTPAKFAIIRAGYTSRSTGTQNKDNAFEDLYSTLHILTKEYRHLGCTVSGRKTENTGKAQTVDHLHPLRRIDTGKTSLQRDCRT